MVSGRQVRQDGACDDGDFERANGQGYGPSDNEARSCLPQL